jgi:cation diffusion facilitator CzcD-associated flavoprotein CzcO
MADGETANATFGDELSFDPEVLRAKYRAERDKRLRADANTQFVRIDGKFGHFLDDPYVEPGFTRAPLTDEVEILVIGGGFSGLLVAAKLREAGVEGVRIVEKGGDFGGTWYWNRYPGVACDVESYVYLPLLEELGYMPTRKYARGPEIYAHCQAIARKFDLYRDVCFQTKVTELRWDEDALRWIVKTDRDDAMRARFVVMANAAALDTPKLPGIPGIETFEGHTFHTSRWDYDYTGGGPDGGLERLGDKVVGVIGTGATAVQCVPHLAEGARQLFVFQRTPSSVDVRNDRPTDPEWAKSLQPGWHRKRIENFTTLTSGGFAEEDLINDGWTDIVSNITLIAQKKIAAGEPVEDPAALMQLADFKKMEQIRARVDAVVEDKASAEALKPYYNQFCKRPCFHDEYLPAFNRPNVKLVDTDGKGVERITERGVVVGGQEYPLDCLVFATGFEVGMKFERRFGYPVIGRGGVALHEKWSKGAATLHGFFTRGFPNVLILSAVQSAFAFNFAHLLDEQTTHIAYVLAQAQATGAKVVEASQSGEDGWVAEIDRAALQREAFLKECTPGYYNYEGDLALVNSRNGPYGAGALAYFDTLTKWREAGGLEGLEISR